MVVPPVPTTTLLNVMLSVDICHWKPVAPVVVTLKLTVVVPLGKQIVFDDGCVVIDGAALIDIA